MNAYSYFWRFALYLCVFEEYSSAYLLLTTSSDKASSGIDFNFTCNYYPFADDVAIENDVIYQCRFRMPCRLYYHNINYTCICNNTAIVLTIPDTFDIDTLHGSQWRCIERFRWRISNTLQLNVNVNLEAIPNDKNPTDILSGSNQTCTCTTDAGRPSPRIQWYMSGVNITNMTNDATVQADTCNPGCNDKVISSSVLIYIGNITDNGKTIYCTALNIDETGVRSQDKNINILYKPVISEIPDCNITEGRNLKITPTIDANPDPISVWWTRQNQPEFIFYGEILTIRSIQRVYSDNYTCHAMNPITAQGHPTKNRSSDEMFNVNVQFLQQRKDSINNPAVGVGTGIAVTIFIVGVTLLNLFLYRKRRLSKSKEQRNSEVYETEIHEPRETQQTDKHLYNELGGLKTGK